MTEPGEWDPEAADLEKDCAYQHDDSVLTHLHYKQADGSMLIISAQQIKPDGTYGTDLEQMATTLVQMLLPSQPAEIEGRPALVSPFTYWVKSTIDYYDIDMRHAADREEAYSMGVSL